jgi:hypothetical protein
MNLVTRLQSDVTWLHFLQQIRDAFLLNASLLRYQANGLHLFSKLGLLNLGLLHIDWAPHHVDPAPCHLDPASHHLDRLWLLHLHHVPQLFNPVESQSYVCSHLYMDPTFTIFVEALHVYHIFLLSNKGYSYGTIIMLWHLW